MDRSLVQNIIRAAGPKRAISADDLAMLAPLETMSTEETAELIAEIERAGGEVDVDPALTRPNRSAGARVDSSLRLPEDEHESPPAIIPDRLSTNARPPQEPPGGHRSKAVAWIIGLCALAVLVIWLIAR